MCTLSYIPLGGGKVILTSNRDESIIRPTLPPIEEVIDGHSVFFPKDNVAGGTWIAAGENGRICCLLNGAFEAHERKAYYAKSRGKVVLEVFKYKRLNDFFVDADLTDVEPFTLIIIETAEDLALTEFRWDAREKYVKELMSTQSYIWSSATLYGKPIRELREQWFNKWIHRIEKVKKEDVVTFHTSSHGEDTENNLLMKRSSILQTVSVTQLEVSMRHFQMDYHDLVKNELTSVSRMFNIIGHA